MGYACEHDDGAYDHRRDAVGARQRGALVPRLTRRARGGVAFTVLVSVILIRGSVREVREWVTFFAVVRP